MLPVWSPFPSEDNQARAQSEEWSSARGTGGSIRVSDRSMAQLCGMTEEAKPLPTSVHHALLFSPFPSLLCSWQRFCFFALPPLPHLPISTWTCASAESLLGHLPLASLRFSCTAAAAVSIDNSSHLVSSEPPHAPIPPVSSFLLTIRICYSILDRVGQRKLVRKGRARTHTVHTT